MKSSVVKLKCVKPSIRCTIRADMGFPPRNGFLKLLNCTIYDEELFASPPPPLDCPICFLPMGFMHTYQPCCGKNLCDGCMYAHKKKANEFNCPFCRHPVASTNDERFELTKKRMACSDSNAFVMMGLVYLQGTKEIKQDFGKAVALWEKAVELGSELAHFYLGCAYDNGQGVKEDLKIQNGYVPLATCCNWWKSSGKVQFGAHVYPFSTSSP